MRAIRRGSFLRDTEGALTLVLRRASRLANPDPNRITIAEGDVLDPVALRSAMPGRRILDPCRDAAAAIERSDPDDQILRPGWSNRADAVDYAVTLKGEAFKRHVSLNSVSDLIIKVAMTADLYVRCSVGVSLA